MSEEKKVLTGVTGKVKWFNPEKGYGFITANDGTEYFIHYTGISIDGVLTSQLLINIFEKNTPLHDGAVIIKNNRVSAATCFLPLTDSMDVSLDLGTRHRAAIGISEVTDAIVIVVSEENGVISYVRGGKIRRNLDADMIRKILLSTRKKKRNEKKILDRKRAIWKGRVKDE